MAVVWRGDAVRAEVRMAVMRGLVIGGNLVRSESIRLILRTQKSGRTYTRRGITHKASAPGEAPASDTGRLVNSIKVIDDEPNLVVYVNVSAEYGDDLEFGTENMEPRPYLRPALLEKEKAIVRRVTLEVKRATRREGR